MFKRIATLLALIGIVSLSSTQLALAATDPFKNVDCSAGSGSAVCVDKSSGKKDPITSTVQKAVTVVATITGVAAVIVMIVAGISYITSTGDPTKVNNAKNTIIYALIGLIVVILARTIIIFVINRV